MKEQVFKCDYESPNMEVLSVQVESGYQTSGTQDEETLHTTQYEADSWDNVPNSNNSPQYT